MANGTDDAVGAASEVDGQEMQEASPRQRQAVARAKERGIGEQNLRWQDSFLKETLRAIKIVEDRFEEAGSLNQALLQLIGFFRRDEQRHGIELPRSAMPTWIAVKVVGDAVGAQNLLGFIPAVRELVKTETI